MISQSEVLLAVDCFWETKFSFHKGNDLATMPSTCLYINIHIGLGRLFLQKRKLFDIRCEKQSKMKDRGCGGYQLMIKIHCI